MEALCIPYRNNLLAPLALLEEGKQDVTKSFYQINRNYLVVLMSSFFFEYLQLLLKPLYRKIKVTGLLSYVLATRSFFRVPIEQLRDTAFLVRYHRVKPMPVF